MPCYAPLTGYYSSERTRNGKRRILFDKKSALSGVPVTLPCGGCIGCRLDKTRSWAVRSMHELRMHKVSSFVTLTYDDNYLPEDGSLDKSELQRFMKRLRKVSGNGLRFYGCGEYGDNTNRPHYHILLFNYDFSDKKLLSRSASGNDLYVSPTLSRIWPLGHHSIGAVTYDSCAYVARYVTKKITGSIAADWYAGREPEFAVMSRRPGLGHGYYMKYAHEIYAHDNVIINGVETPVPRYYDNLYKMLDAKTVEELKVRRRRRAIANGRADNTLDRRRVREVYALRRMKAKEQL